MNKRIKYIYLVPPVSVLGGCPTNYLWTLFKWVTGAVVCENSSIILPENLLSFLEPHSPRRNFWGFEVEHQAQMGYKLNIENPLNNVPFHILDIRAKENDCHLSNPHLRFVDYVRGDYLESTNLRDILLDYIDIGFDVILVTWLNSHSLKRIVNSLNIKVVFNELGPLRSPYYRQTAFFDFSGVNGDTSSAEKWQSDKETFISWLIKTGITKEFVRKLLAPNVSAEKIQTSTDTSLGVALQVEDDSNALVYNKGWTTLALLASITEKNSRIRIHPGGKALYHGNIDLSPNPLSFIARCEKMLTINSSIGIECIFWDKQIKFLGENPGTFLLDVPEAESMPAWVYFFIVYLIPFEFIFDREYYHWRCSNPSASQIADKHIKHYSSLPPSGKEIDISFVRTGEIYKDIDFRKDVGGYSMIKFLERGRSVTLQKEELAKNKKTIEELRSELIDSEMQLAEYLEKISSYHRMSKDPIITLYRKIRRALGIWHY